MKCIVFTFSSYNALGLKLSYSFFSFRLNKYVLSEPKSEAEKELRFSIGTLRYEEQADGRPRSVFKLVEESGPDQNNVMSFTVTCTQGEHVTHGKLDIYIILNINL